MKKLTALILVIIFSMPLSGCAIFQHKKYAKKQEEQKKMVGWEYVRIEREIPHKDCKYVIQEACSNRGAECYNTFKKNAKIRGANVVVVTEDIRSWREGSSLMTGAWKGDEVATTLADFYACPKYEIKQTAPSDARKSTNRNELLLRVEQPK
jgi:hypothetical protein